MSYRNEEIEEILTPQLEDILRDDINYDQDEAKENVGFMWDAISGLIAVMKRMDPLFSEVYSRIVHAGSYYEDLRVTSPTEFDLQIVLDFPFPTEDFTIAMPSADSPFVTYQLKETPKAVLYRNYKWRHPYKKLNKFFTKDGFLSSHEVLLWVHELMESAFESDEFRQPRTVSDIERKHQASSSPAFTLEITGADSNRTIDVDLVAVLNTCSSKIPRKMPLSRRFRQLLRNGKSTQWFLVPKPSKNEWETDPRKQTLWRNAFPSAEKQLLSGTGCLRDMIKIFKRLRDVNGNWRKPLFSYVFKSFFMRSYDKNPDLDYWSDDNLGQVFLESLKEFQEAMESCYIPDYYNPKANMIDNINPDAAQNIAGRIRNIVSSLEDEPYSILAIFHHGYEH